jgi:Mn2+/Fe2+ NRAMP family transporter
VQFICAKIGLVCGVGLASVIRRHYPRWLLYTVVLGLLIANTGDPLQGRQARHPVGRRGGPGAASAGRRCRGDPVRAGDDRLRFLAVPVLAGSAGYAVGEAFGWKVGLDRKPRRAPQFYGVIAASMLVGMLINFIGINPIAALVWAAVINGLLTSRCSWSSL